MEVVVVAVMVKMVVVVMVAGVGGGGDCGGSGGGGFVCLFGLILYAPSTIFQLYRDGSSWVEPVLSENKCVLLKDHNAETLVRLEPAALWSRVKHSTTEPLRSHGGGGCDVGGCLGGGGCWG